MVAAHAVDGAAHRVDHEAQGHGIRLDARVQPERRVEGPLARAVLHQFHGVEETASADVADMGMGTQGRAQALPEVGAVRPDGFQQVVPLDHRLHRQRRGGGDRLLAYKDVRLWTPMDAVMVNDYLRESTGAEITAKDFRTWHATVLAAAALVALVVLYVGAGGVSVVARTLGSTITSFVEGVTATPTPSTTPLTVAEAPTIESPAEPYTNQNQVDLSVTVPSRLAGSPDYLVRVPERLLPVGVLLEPTSVIEKGIIHAYEIQRRLKVWRPRRAAVLGAGTIGLLAAMSLRMRGLEVTSFGRSPAPYQNSDLLAEIGVRYVSTAEMSLKDAAAKFGPFDLMFERERHAGDPDRHVDEEDPLPADAGRERPAGDHADIQRTVPGTVVGERRPGRGVVRQPRGRARDQQVHQVHAADRQQCTDGTQQDVQRTADVTNRVAQQRRNSSKQAFIRCGI